jgi:hypothetical protein
LRCTRLARVTFELRSLTPNMVPRGSRTDEEVHRYLNTRITVDATERHSMNRTIVRSTERRPAPSAETQAPTGTGFVVHDIPLSGYPNKGATLHLGVCRACSAECLAAARTVTAARGLERRAYFVANSSAKAAASQNHGASQCCLTMSLSDRRAQFDKGREHIILTKQNSSTLLIPIPPDGGLRSIRHRRSERESGIGH